MKFQITIFLFSISNVLISQTDIIQLCKSGAINQLTITDNLPQILDNDLIFYGFIHGAAMPQEIEAKLLKELMDEGIKYYAPEVSYSGAYFLNKYLQSGNMEFLKYVLRLYIAPQDASLQWIQKYEDLYKYKTENNLQLTVIGTDIEQNDNLITSHLAYILGERKTANEIIDSLSLFKTPEEDIAIWSGKPLYKLSIKYGYSNKKILYESHSQHNYTSRYFEYYLNNRQLVLEAFGTDSIEVKIILDDHLMRENSREEFITKNFIERVLPLIDNGEKVYSNFGYAHVLQSELNDNLYLAGRLKESNPDLKIYSILTHMADSEVLKNKKYCKEGSIRRYGKKIRLASICGSITSKKLDGNTKDEKILGIDELRTKTNKGEITLVALNSIREEDLRKRYYLDYISGKNPDGLRFESDKSTLDYFQGLIFIRGSSANEPYENY